MPDNTENLNMLEELNLINNRLKTLPKNIGRLTVLKEIFLYMNQLRELPDSIGELKHLKSLSFYKNQLTYLPDSIGNLTALEELDLIDNRLSQLPNNIGELKHLKRLNLHNNQLTKLPDSIGNLIVLEELVISHNQLTVLPNNIGRLTALKKILLSSNQLRELPDSIGKLTVLEELDLYNNRLTSLPNNIGGLKSIEKLNLINNLLNQITDSIIELTKLKTLYLCKNQLTALPNDIGRLTALKKLDLSNNQLRELPNSIGELTALKKLYVCGNQLTVLPNNIGRLTALKKILLSRNQLTYLPDSIGNLTALEELDLSSPILGYNSNRNHFQSLPHSILRLSPNCIIYISAEYFSEQVMRNLQDVTQDSGYNGPTISFSMGSEAPNEDSRSLEALLQIYFKTAELSQKEIKFIAHLNNVEKGSLRTWLSRLSTIKTLKREGESEKAFAKKILSYLELADENENFLGVFKGVVHDASATCGDRMALSLIHIDLQFKLASTLLNDPKSVEKLLVHGVKAMGILEEIGREKVKTLPFVDEIEVYLAYPVKLRENLDLPIEVEKMLYYGVSGVREEDLEEAALKVQSFYDNEQERLEFLVKQDKWIEVLKHHDNDRYKRIKEEGVERVDEDPEYYHQELIKFSRDILQIK